MPADRVFRIGLDGTGPHCGIPCDGARSMFLGEAIINFKPSGLLGEWEFTPRDIARSARKLKRKLGLKKEEN